MRTFIFTNELEKIIISVKNETTIQELINEYYKRVQKKNLIYNNIEKTYFMYNCEKINYNNNKETVQSYFNENLETINVRRLDYGNYFRDFEKIRTIKDNIYTSVIEAKINKENCRIKNVAVKKINKDKIKEDMMEDLCLSEITEKQFLPEIRKFNEEIKNMELCHCENSVEIYDYFDTEKEFIIVMELCDDTLLHKLSETENGFDKEQIKDILLQLNNVFKKMQEYKITHRDIKLNNILIKYLDDSRTKFKVLLSDYGISNQLNGLTKRLKTYAGTQKIMAPEILNNEKYNSKCDLWSLGVTIYRLKTKRLPYTGKVDKEILDEIEEKGLSVLDTITDDKLKNLLSRLLVRDPKNRISWEDYFEHDFFK